MDAVLSLDRAQDFDAVPPGGRPAEAPSQNLVYADTRGNIGYQLPGAMPRAARVTAGCPPRAGTPGYDWRGTIPFAELPYAYNPPSGVLVAANQPVIGSQYPLSARVGVLLRLAQPGDCRRAA